MILINKQMELRMTKEQKELIVSLLTTESVRLTSLLCETKHQMSRKLVKAEREFVNKATLAVRGGK